MNRLAPLRVGVIGCGAIGGPVARALHAGEIPGAILTGVATRNSRPTGLPARSLPGLLADSDLVVEAAGQAAVRACAEQILCNGQDLLIVSVGALADDRLRNRLLAAGPGRPYYSTGALGGLDLLSAAGSAARFHRVRLTTTKLPRTLVQPWMDEDTAQRIRTTTEPMTIFRGTAAEVTASFPSSTNVAAALALACRTWDVEVTVRVDPSARLTQHLIEADGPYGTYRFEVNNVPDDHNPATSKVVPDAVLREIATIAGVGNRVL